MKKTIEWVIFFSILNLMLGWLLFKTLINLVPCQKHLECRQHILNEM